jgi:hypothetical protein
VVTGTVVAAPAGALPPSERTSVGGGSSDCIATVEATGVGIAAP